MDTMPRWTAESRLKQAEKIRNWSPWSKSTGPRTADGRARSSRNAFKGGIRAQIATFAGVMREIETANREVISSFCRGAVFPMYRVPRSYSRGSVLDCGGEAFSRDTAFVAARRSGVKKSLGDAPHDALFGANLHRPNQSGVSAESLPTAVQDASRQIRRFSEQRSPDRPLKPFAAPFRRRPHPRI